MARAAPEQSDRPSCFASDSRILAIFAGRGSPEYGSTGSSKIDKGANAGLPSQIPATKFSVVGTRVIATVLGAEDEAKAAVKSSRNFSTADQAIVRGSTPMATLFLPSSSFEIKTYMKKMNFSFTEASHAGIVGVSGSPCFINRQFGSSCLDAWRK